VLVLVLLSASFVCAQDPFVGGYVLLSRSSRNGEIVGLSELNMLVESADSIPVNRIWLSFFAPTMVYVPGSFTLEHARLNVSKTGDFGFAAIRSAIVKLQAAGVEVFLSMGGWNYNCFPYMYARYSVGGYGENTPNYWKIEKFGGGDINKCVADNQYCYVCEPPSEGTSLEDFQIFPEPEYSPTWKQATDMVEAHANASNPPKWSYDMVAGKPWTDPKTGIQVIVPGDNYYVTVNRDPYQDLVYLAKDLGAAGIDIDYEEFWHGDYFKVGDPQGPWVLPQTTYKYAAIVMDTIININNIYPELKLSTAAGAVGAWSTNWWGGNLKGLWYNMKQLYPNATDFMSKGANAGGINVMSYDLSDNPQFHECPDDNDCSLDKQVAFYMKAYQDAQIPANVGYEVGVPAYPSPDHDASHQLPLTHAMLSSIVSQTQTQFPSAFFWELFKEQNQTDYASATQVAQTLCSAILKSRRCVGALPNVTAY